MVEPSTLSGYEASTKCRIDSRSTVWAGRAPSSWSTSARKMCRPGMQFLPSAAAQKIHSSGHWLAASAASRVGSSELGRIHLPPLHFCLKTTIHFCLRTALCPAEAQNGNLVDPASRHSFVSKIKPCTCKNNRIKVEICEWLIKSVIVYLILFLYMDTRSNSRANTCLFAAIAKEPRAN